MNTYIYIYIYICMYMNMTPHVSFSTPMYTYVLVHTCHQRALRSFLDKKSVRSGSRRLRYKQIDSVIEKGS